MKEFVLKESSCGDKALSILVDSDLIRVARISRIGASPSVEDILATRRDSYTGFSHQRLDWLDDFKGVWWVVAGASLISSFMISALFLIPFTIAALLVLLQLMDPERFVVSTNSGNHPFYINRWRSNRELTDLAMDLVDDAMIAVLRGEDLETEKLDARAELIANRFTVNMKAQQMAEKLAAAEKEAKRQAAEAAAAAQQMAMMEAQQKAAEQHAAMMQAQQMTPGQQIAMAEASGSQPNQPTPPGMQSSMMQTSPNEQMPMQSEEPAVENQESTEGDDQSQGAAQQEEVESDGDEGSDEISDTTEEIEDTNSEEEMPQAPPEETPVVIPPPPSTTAMIPPPPTGPPVATNPCAAGATTCDNSGTSSATACNNPSAPSAANTCSSSAATSYNSSTPGIANDAPTSRYERSTRAASADGQPNPSSDGYNSTDVAATTGIGSSLTA